MIRANLDLLLPALRDLEDVRRNCAATDANASVGEKWTPQILGLLKLIDDICGPLECTRACSRIPHITKELESTKCSARALSVEIRVLQQSLEQDLNERLFFHIPARKARYYLRPDEEFGKAWDSFKSAQPDMSEACRSYAADRNGACVYHCVGVFQRGLYALSAALDISLLPTIELENWLPIIEQIEKSIRQMQALPKGHEKDVELRFYSDAAMHVLAIKDAIRNVSAHARGSYNEADALSKLTHAVEFMKHLATRLSE